MIDASKWYVDFISSCLAAGYPPNHQPLAHDPGNLCHATSPQLIALMFGSPLST